MAFTRCVDQSHGWGRTEAEIQEFCVELVRCLLVSHHSPSSDLNGNNSDNDADWRFDLFVFLIRSALKRHRNREAALERVVHLLASQTAMHGSHTSELAMRCQTAQQRRRPRAAVTVATILCFLPCVQSLDQQGN